MLRRRHKKSRAGCVECKRRHVKCDEQRPVCSLCSVSDRKCTYVPVPPPLYPADDSSCGSPRRASPSPSPRAAHANPIIAPALPVFPVPPSAADGPVLVDDADATININHAELIVHLMTNADIQSLAADHRHFANGMVLGMKAGVRTPYLLYAMLALSARHLAYIATQGGEGDWLGDAPLTFTSSSTTSSSSPSSSPSYSLGNTPSSIHATAAPSPAPAPASSPAPAPAPAAARYQRLADVLQTRAVSLFNTAWRAARGVVDQSNCLPMLLFSSVLGHHLFADSLARRDAGGLGGFLAHFVQCAQLQQGVYVIATATWPLLLASEFAPILEWSARFTSRAARGRDCARLLAQIERAPAERLGAADKEACRRAVRLLQVGFDVLFLPAGSDVLFVPARSSRRRARAAADGTAGGGGGGGGGEAEQDEQRDTYETNEETERGYRHKMILLWALITPKEFADLLAAKRPEALVVLAYYAWLLHHGRHLWQVGDAGAYIMGLVSDHLGPAWDDWLDYPRQRIATDAVVALSP